jgi:hypothetical protein
MPHRHRRQTVHRNVGSATADYSEYGQMDFCLITVGNESFDKLYDVHEVSYNLQG